MIGQTRQLQYFKDRVENNDLKGFYVVGGPGKSGKTHLIYKVAEFSGMPVQYIDKPKIMEVRDLIDRCNHLSVPTIFCINKADRIGMAGQNALLKLLEEPPAYAHIFLEVEDENNILPTIKSRAITIELSPYNMAELKEATNNSDLLAICENVGQIKDMENLDYKGLNDFVKKIRDSIGQISIMNVFNISKYVAFKEGDKGFDLEIIMGAIQRAFKDDYNKGVIIAEHRRQMRHVSINKKNSFEIMMVKIWEDERRKRLK